MRLLHRSFVLSFHHSVVPSVRPSVRSYVVSSFARTSVQRRDADGTRCCRYWCPLLSLEAWQWSVVAAGATLALMLCVYIHDLWTSDNSDDDSIDGGSKRTSQHKPLRADEEDSDEYGAETALFVSRFVLQMMIISPRQARDKHRKLSS